MLPTPNVLALAAQPQPLGEPRDWQRTSLPTEWRLTRGEHAYDWIGGDEVATVP